MHGCGVYARDVPNTNLGGTVRRLLFAAAAVLAAFAPATALAATTWRADSVPQPAGVDFTNFNGAFVASPTQAWAVGMQRQSSSLNFTQLIESWNGSAWGITSGATVPGATITELNGASGSGPGDVWAVGNQNGSNSTLIEHFNGTAWTNVSSPAVAAGSLTAVSADSSADAWAVGGQFVAEAHNSFTTSLTEHWNGSSWQQVSNPFGTSTNNTRATLVSVAAVTPSDAWAIGLKASGRSHSTVLENWNGSSWNIVAQPVSGAILNSLSATSPDDVWAVGNNGLIEHFNGTAWTQVPDPAGEGQTLAAVTALSSTDAWTAASNGAVTEQWNGSQWNAVPVGQLPEGFRLASLAGRAGGPLFAVGGNDGGGNNLSTILQQPQP